MIKLFSRTTARVMNGIGDFGVERNDEWSPASRGRKDAVISHVNVNGVVSVE